MEKDFSVQVLGDCPISSPMREMKFLRQGERVLYHSTLAHIAPYLESGQTPPTFEMAGPRARIHFDPEHVKCGIVTCGGICPGLNDVIRAIVLALYHLYGVKSILGFRFGYEGLVAKYGHEPLRLTRDLVSDLHTKGGTVLGSSRGPQEVSEMVDTLERMGIDILFTVGGDGTLKGARAIAQEIARRNLDKAVVGIPKTIDNDISHVEWSFGFETAVSEARKVIETAHTEAIGARNGIGLVKLMGRESGFIAAYATISSADVNFCLVPEVPFSLGGLLRALKQRVEQRKHAVIVVGEGAGQYLMEETQERDQSGNVRFSDIGVFLKSQITRYFKEVHEHINLKYIDPSYVIRSMPANARDSAFCLVLGQNAVHAAMAGRTNMVVGFWNNHYTHVPISVAVSRRKQIDPDGRLWNDVLACTGQPRSML